MNYTKGNQLKKGSYKMSISSIKGKLEAVKLIAEVKQEVYEIENDYVIDTINEVMLELEQLRGCKK